MTLCSSGMTFYVYCTRNLTIDILFVLFFFFPNRAPTQDPPRSHLWLIYIGFYQSSNVCRKNHLICSFCFKWKFLVFFSISVVVAVVLWWTDTDGYVGMYFVYCITCVTFGSVKTIVACCIHSLLKQWIRFPIDVGYLHNIS